MRLLNRIYPSHHHWFLLLFLPSFFTSIICEVRSQMPWIEKVKTQGGTWYTLVPVLTLQAPHQATCLTSPFLEPWFLLGHNWKLPSLWLLMVFLIPSFEDCGVYIVLACTSSWIQANSCSPACNTYVSASTIYLGISYFKIRFCLVLEVPDSTTGNIWVFL